MKYGRPLLVVAQGDAREMLSKANGSFFASEDPKDIARVIDELCESKEKDLLGLNNKKYFEAHFTTEKLTQSLLEELISAKK